jgi:cytochrome bd-type quinol oxidase subunit 2
MDEPFSWDYLTSVPRPDEVFTPFTTAFLLICAIGLLAGYTLYARPEIAWSRRLLRVRTARRWGSILSWVFSLGFFFFLVGWLQINPFTLGERIWLYLTLLAAIVAVALLALTIRNESQVLSHERRVYQDAVARGVHMRRPPKLSRTRKR